MAEQTLGIRIKIDSDTGKLTVLNKEFDSLGKSSAQASSQLSSFDGTMAAINTRMVAVVAAGYAAKNVFDMTVGSGVALNSQFEQMKLGIASLIAVNSSNTTAMGHSISTVQKFQMAQAQATESVDLLRKANLQTPATLAQITEGYQAALGPSLRLGLSTKQTVEYVKLMTMAAAAMGQPMEQIAQESRALLSGEIDMNAQVARNLQITNEQIKMHTKQGDLYEFLTKKLGDFAAGGEAMSNSWEGISSNITDSIQTIQQKATEGIFDALKADGIDLQHKLSENANEIADAFAHGFSNAYLVAAPAAENIYLAFEVSLSSINILLNSFTDMFNTSIDGMNNKYRELGFFDYLSLGLIVGVEGFRQLGDVGLSIITFLGSMMNKFQSITLDAFAGITGAMGALTELIGLDGSSFYESQAYWVKKSNAVKQDGLLIDQTQKAILGDMVKGVDRLGHSYNQLALIKDKPPRSGSNDSLITKEKEAVAKTAEELKKAQADKLKAIRELEAEEKKAHDGRVKAMDEINKKTARAQKWGEDQIKKIEERAKLEFQADQERTAALKTYNEGLITAQIDYYTNMGDTSSAYYLQEEEKMRKLAETGWYTNEQMLAIKSKDNQKFLDEQWKKDNAFWVDLFSNINKAMDDQFFNAMTGKFTSFGSWLKDFWGSITQSMTRGLSKSLADMMTGTLYKSSEDGSISGLIPSLTRGIGSSLFGMSALGSVQAMAGSTVLDGITTTEGGTVLDAAGNITTSGTDVASIMNNMSTLNTAYNALTGGLSASIANGFAQGAAYTYNGLTAMGMSTGTAGSIAGGIGNFGAGLASPWSMAGSGGAAGAGAMLGGAAIGAAGGYAVGKIGDKLLGAETKAANYAAIGGAIGSLAGPLGTVAGAIIGSLIGGAFGSTKVQQSGLHFAQVTGGDDASISLVQSWAEMRKKSWFSSSEWNEYSDLSSAQRNAIEGIFDTYDYLLGQLGSIDKITIAAGNYTQAQFENTLAKSFISTFTGIRETLTTTLHTIWGDWEVDFGTSNPVFDEVYNQWVDYAKSIDKSVTQALTDSVNTFVQSSRSFEIWSLERSGNSAGSLQKQAEWAQQSFTLLSESMGVAGLSVETFSQQYEAAVKANFSNETITQWDSLGKALMSATDAQDAYTKAIGGTTLALTLEAQKSTVLNVLNTELGTLQNTLANLSKEYTDRTAELITLAKNQVSTLRGVQSAIHDLSKYQQGLYLDKSLSPLSSVERFAAYGEKVLSLQSEAQAAYDTKDYATFNEKLGDLQGISSGYLDVAKELSVSSAEYGNSFSFIQSILSDFTATSFQDPVVSEIINLEAITAQYGGITEAGFTDISARITDLINIIPSLGSQMTATQSAITSKQAQITSVPTSTDPLKDLVNRAYDVGLGRTADAGGAAFWYQALSNGTLSVADFNTEFTKAATLNNENINSFAVGSPRIPYDMEAKIHKDEIIIDAKSSDVLRKYGIPSYPVIPKTSNTDQGATTSILNDVKGIMVNMAAEVMRLRQEFSRMNENGTAMNVRITT